MQGLLVDSPACRTRSRIRVEADIHELLLEDTGPKPPQYPYFLRSRPKHKRSLRNGYANNRRYIHKQKINCKNARDGTRISKNNHKRISESSSPRNLQWPRDDRSFPETPCTSLCNVIDALSLADGRRLRNNVTSYNDSMPKIVRSGSYNTPVDSTKRMITKTQSFNNTSNPIPKLPRVHSSFIHSSSLIDPLPSTQQKQTTTLPTNHPHLNFHPPSSSTSNNSFTPNKNNSITKSNFQNITIPSNFNDTPYSNSSSQPNDQLFLTPPNSSPLEYLDHHAFTPQNKLFKSQQLLPPSSHHFSSFNQYNTAVSESENVSLSSSVYDLAEDIRQGDFTTLSSLKSLTPESSDATYFDDDNIQYSPPHSYIVNDLKNYLNSLPPDTHTVESSIYEDDCCDFNYNPNPDSIMESPRPSTPAVVSVERSFFYVSENSGKVIPSQTEYPDAIVVTRFAEPTPSNISIQDQPPPQLDTQSFASPPSKASPSTADLTCFNRSSNSTLYSPLLHTNDDYDIAATKENIKLRYPRPFSLLLDNTNDGGNISSDSWSPMKKVLQHSLDSKIAASATDDSVLYQLSLLSNKFRQTSTARRMRGLSFPP